MWKKTRTIKPVDAVYAASVGSKDLRTQKDRTTDREGQIYGQSRTEPRTQKKRDTDTEGQ